MIPLRDATRSPVRFPLVTVGLIAVNVVAFIWEIGSDDAAILRLTVVPAQLMRGQGWITPFTAMFLHGGFIHIISNLLFLSVFAPAVEDMMGRARFLVFYVTGTVSPGSAQTLLS
jgi:membrane associated rhomboid family serine protease